MKKKNSKVKIGTAIDQDLLDEVKELCDKENITLTTAIEYGLEQFLKHFATTKKDKSNLILKLKELINEITEE